MLPFVSIKLNPVNLPVIHVFYFVKQQNTSELPVCVWKANAGFTSLLNADSDRQLPLLTFELTTIPTYELDRKPEDINGPISAERFFIKVLIQHC